MLDILAGSSLLTVFVVVALGTLLGSFPFGPIRFGPAGGLFVGLAVGALDDRLGQGLGLLQTLGLALFVYTVGLAGGYQLVATFKRQLPTLIAGFVVLAATAAVAAGGGLLLGLSAPMTAGAFSGSLTATAALAAATDASGSGEPAVGYSLGYPVGVTLSIFVIAVLVTRRWPGRRDTAPTGAGGLHALSVAVAREAHVSEVPGWRDQTITMSYLVRDGAGRVVTDDDRLLRGDKVLVIGDGIAGPAALAYLGHELPDQLTDDRTDLDHRRFTVSNQNVAGRTVADLDLPRRYGGRATRVYRGDNELLARDDLVLELGDRVLAVLPKGCLENVGAEVFGDSERRVSEIDALTLAVGLAFGLMVGIIPIPLGPMTLKLGAAAGPLLVGLLLGRLVRTGPFVWTLPSSANLTLRQLGLFLFLACVGLASGPAFASTVLTRTGLIAAAFGGAVTLAACLFTWIAGRVLQLSAPRTAGIMSGIIGQPAVLAFAMSKSDDERIEASYTSLFAVGTVVKILLAYVLAVLW